MENIRESVSHIKQTLRWFPGLVLGLGRQVGKTSALLEVIHDDLDGFGTVYSVNHSMSLYAKQMYIDKYGKEKVPNFVSQTEKVRGRSDNIFADEWWHIPTQDRRTLIGTGRLAARIGTEFGQRDLGSMVVRFTDEELDLLESLFEAFVTGRGTYCINGVPENKDLNRDLHRKFKREKELV